MNQAELEVGDKVRIKKGVKVTRFWGDTIGIDIGEREGVIASKHIGYDGAWCYHIQCGLEKELGEDQPAMLSIEYLEDIE